MFAGKERWLYVAVDTRGNCRPVSYSGSGNRCPISGAVRYLGQLLDDGWQLVTESPAGRSESSIVLLKRDR